MEHALSTQPSRDVYSYKIKQENLHGVQHIYACKVHRIAAQSQASVPDRSGRMYRPAYRANTGKSRPGNNNNRPSKFCHICMRNGHATQECWFNGRNEGWSMRQPR